MSIPAAAILGPTIFTPNVGWLFMCVTTGMYLIYEFMHFCCHLDESWFVKHFPFVNTLRRHHTAHHNARLMMEVNMNLTFPIAYSGRSRHPPISTAACSATCSPSFDAPSQGPPARKAEGSGRSRRHAGRGQLGREERRHADPCQSGRVRRRDFRWRLGSRSGVARRSGRNSTNSCCSPPFSSSSPCGFFPGRRQEGRQETVALIHPSCPALCRASTSC